MKADINVFEAELSSAWAEATSGGDIISNTEIILKQINEAKKTITKVIAVTARLVGNSYHAETTSVMNEIDAVLDGYSQGSIIVALGLVMLTHLESMQASCEYGISVEERKTPGD